MHNPKKYIAIDEILATAEMKDSVTGKTTYYTRVLFAKGINRHNLETKLSMIPPAIGGDWLET